MLINVMLSSKMAFLGTHMNGKRPLTLLTFQRGCWLESLLKTVFSLKTNIMKDKELQEDLLLHYETVITKVKKCKNITKIYSILLNTSTRHGLCYCALYEFNSDIGLKPWVKKFMNIGGLYWSKPPAYLNTKEEIIDSLQVRITNLKILLNKTS